MDGGQMVDAVGRWWMAGGDGSSSSGQVVDGSSSRWAGGGWQ